MKNKKPIIDYNTNESEINMNSQKGNTESNTNPQKENNIQNKEESLLKNTENKKAINKKIVIGIISFVVIFILALTIFTVYFQINRGREEPLNDAHTIIDDNTQGTQNMKSYASGTKIDIPNGDVGLYSLSQAVEVMINVNDANLGYLNEIREAVLAFKNQTTSASEFEQDLLKFKEYLSSDINIFSRYRTVYETYENEEVYETEMLRLQNEYTLVNNLSSAMTSNALISTFNHHIEIEMDYNEQVVKSMKAFLDRNNINYSVNEGFIQIEQ